MIKSVVREYKWPPEIIGGLFVDSQDYLGLEYWYEDVIAINEILKAKGK